MMIKDKDLYYVGGVVRDEILGIESVDIDLCYEGDAIEFSQKLGLNIIKTNPDFGTVRVLLDNREIDIASTRKEIYPKKGHLPKVTEIGCPLDEDLNRRDFTINALAKRTTDGKIFDIFGGKKDLENKKLRILHNQSFIDDPTRIIRGLKFSARFNMELEETTKKLQEEYLNNINYDMSYHRLKNELVDTFNLNKSVILNKFIVSGIYRLLGENIQKPKINIAAISEIENTMKDIKDSDTWLVYLSFFDLSNLGLTRSEKRILEWAERLNSEKAGNNTPPLSIVINKLKHSCNLS